MKINKHININFIFKKLRKNINYHKNNSKEFANLENQLLKYLKENISNKYKKFKILNVSLNLKNFKFGKLNLINIMGLDEMIIFDFYKCDIGANIGFHSLFLRKLKYRNVTSYEPDKKHIKKSKELFKNNKVSHSINNFAITDKFGEIRFTRLLDNTTGSHVHGLKKNVYGKTKIIKVKTIPIKSLINKFDLLKIDCEGSEKIIFRSTRIEDWKKSDSIVEITDKEARKFIWDKFKNSIISIYSQKTGWKKCKKLIDLPKSHREGSIFISYNSRFF